MAAISYLLLLTTQKHLPGTEISAYMGGVYISEGNMWKNINQKDHSQPIQEYLQSKFGWSDQVMDKIDWDIFQETMEKRPIHKSTNIIKYIHRWQHMGRQKYQFNDKTKESRYKMCNKEEA